MYTAAQVFRPYIGKYTASPERKSLKATFHDARLVNFVRKQLPGDVELLPSEHVDLVKYSTGDFFKEHIDFVDRYPHGGEQVTVIVGLQTALSGGTRIRVNSQMELHNESITKGGVLIFPSHLPHSGEIVKGEKEILVFKGFLFVGRTPNRQLTSSVYCDTVHVLAIYEEFQSFYYTSYIENENDVDKALESTPLPRLYFYQHNTRIAVYDARDEWCIRHYKKRRIESMQHEQAHALETENDTGYSYPLLAAIVQRKQLLRCFQQSTNQQTFSKTRYTYEREFCNDGYDSVKVPRGITHRHCKHFCVSFFNPTYYTFWLHHIYPQLPDSVHRIIHTFLIL